MSILAAITRAIGRCQKPAPPAPSETSAAPLTPAPLITDVPPPAPPVVHVAVDRSIAKAPHHKRHIAGPDGKPICGGGNGGKKVLGWQEDFTTPNCAACLTIAERKKNP